MASASSSIEIIPRLPPVIPLRESSSSKEVQRTQAVADLLVRLSHPRRFTRKQPISKQVALDKVTGSPSTNANLQPSSTPCPVLEVQSTPPSEGITPESSISRPPSSLSPTPKELERRDSNTTTHLVWNARKPLPPLPTNAIEPRTSRRLSQDLKLSTFRYPVAYLPNVKEDLHKDSSINTSVSNLKSSSLKLPITHPPSRRVSTEDFRLFKNPSVKSFQRPPSTSKGLAQTRNLPSLNFSRMDLIGKLNEALDMRSSKSLDGMPDDYSDLFSPILERHSFSGEVREKYKSFFVSLDEPEKLAENMQPTTIMDLVPARQMYSPRELIVEIGNLTIPSVGGLAQRLLESLPSPKRFYNSEDKDMDNENDIMEHALEEINEVGGPASNSAQPLARLRPMPVTDDGLYEEMTHKYVLESRLVELTNSAKGCIASLYSKRPVSHSCRWKTPPAELEAPMAAVLRTRSLSPGGNKDHRASFESKLARRSLRSLVSSTTDRLWNVDKNYPWADDMPAIDISLPAPTHLRDASQPCASNLCLSESSDDSQSDHGVYDESASSDDPFKHTRKASKHSILGPISRRIGIHSGPFDTTGYTIGPDSPRNDDRSVGPGDRYPTIGLPPPSALNLEEVRSFFSDDSSRSQRGGSFRKRLMHLKAKLPPVTCSHSAVENHCLQNGDGSPKDSVFVTRPNSSMHTYDGTVGMSRMEFRARKVAEKIKTLWSRSGELLRSMSGRRKLSHWLQDSEVYSGT
jgi:serine/arginine repetitive matrix protein 2